VEKPQRLSGRVQQRDVGVVGANARRGTHGDELGHVPTRGGKRKRPGHPGGHLAPGNKKET
jgi:hypothetical protein